MNAGYYRSEYDGAYIKLLADQAILRNATEEEKKQLRSWIKEASQLSGREWNQFSSIETADEGIIQAAGLMSQYRILLAQIRHRGTTNGSRPESSN